MNENKHIGLICDDAYVLPTIVCIKSIIDNWKSTNPVIFHVCTFGISEPNTDLFKQLNSKDFKIDIHSFNTNEFKNKLNKVLQKTHVSPAALIKFELANYFNELDELLYLDSDIISKGDISQLFEINIKNHYIAASFDYWVHEINLSYHPIKIKREPFYFNSGVMLLNLKKIREDCVSNMLWEYKMNHTKSKLMDQECFNAVCGHKTLPISIKWNFNPEFYSSHRVAEINKVYNESYSNLDALFCDVRLIHFVGKKDKPWIYEGAKLGNYWFKYYSKLRFAKKITLEKYMPEKKSKYTVLKDKIKTQGILGVNYYIIRRLLLLFKDRMC